MQNSVNNIFNASNDRSSRVWEVDSHPNRRLAVLFVLMVLPLLAVAGRLVHLQVYMTDAFAGEWEWTTSYGPCCRNNFFNSRG